MVVLLRGHLLFIGDVIFLILIFKPSLPTLKIASIFKLISSAQPLQSPSMLPSKASVCTHAFGSWLGRAIIFLLAICSNAQQAQVYSIKEVDPTSEKFETILKAVDHEQFSTLIKEHPLSEIKIQQHISGAAYLINLAKADKVYYLEIPTDSVFPDDKLIQACVDKTNEVYQYTSVQGAKKSVAKLKLLIAIDINQETEQALAHKKELKILAWPRKITKDELLTRLQAGEIFPVRIPRSIKCSVCLGFGHKSDKTNMTKDIQCSSCGGQGSVTVEDIYKIKW